MTIYIDPPLWPAHGTLFSHLISDASLEELHAFAARTGIAARAFDRDHYDVAQHRRDELIRAGAQPVGAGELTRVLTGSGLRIPASARPEKLRPRLLASWSRMLPEAGDVAEELLQRWSEPHRHYHGLVHLAAVLREVGALERAGELSGAASPPEAGLAAAQGAPDAPRTSPGVRVRLAAWFHDAVYRGAAGTDEEESAQLALDLLGPHIGPHLGSGDIDDVARLVRLTASHSAHPDDAAGAVLCDADLAVLAGAPRDYATYAAHVRADYAHVPDADFRTGRARVLRSLLQRRELYATATGRDRWEQAARVNLETELDALIGRMAG